jgi:acetate kinase
MKAADSRILTINGGSSSIKFALYQIGEPLQRGLHGKVDRIGRSRTRPGIGGTAAISPAPITNRRRVP